MRLPVASSAGKTLCMIIVALIASTALVHAASALQSSVESDLFTREVFFNIEALLQSVFYILAGITVIGLAVGMSDSLLIWRRGAAENRMDNLLQRLWRALRLLSRNRTVTKDDGFAGLMHFLIMWGIIVLFIGTMLLTVHADTPFKFLVGVNYLIYDLTLDVFGVLLIAGVALALYRRHIIKPRKLNTVFDDNVILTSLLAIAVTGLLVEGLRLATTRPLWEFAWAPVGTAFAMAFLNLPESTVRNVHFWVWWSHALATLSLIAYVPFSKLFHIFASTLSVVFESTRPRGWIPPLTQHSEGSVKGLERFTWKRLIDFDACTVCGRCTDVCPASASGRLLSPMQIIQSLKAYTKQRYGFKTMMRGASSKPLLSEAGFINPEELWGCTSCRACMEVCPVRIEHVYDIIDLRRDLVEEGEVPDTGMNVLNLMAKTGNSYGYPPGRRADWAKDLEVKNLAEGAKAEVLLFIGCLSSYDQRAQKVAQGLVKLLKKAGVDFGVLGKGEFCSGHEARRIGEEGLFELLAEKNMAAISKAGVKKIITISPHCYNAFKNDYPEKGYTLTVQHYSQFLRELLKSGALKPVKPLERTVTFHDPCYLGRHNGEFDAPREILQSINALRLVEMDRRRDKSFCCGGGGGAYWVEVEHQERRMSEIRVKEANEHHPDVLAVACPFCLLNFEDAVKTLRLDDRLLV
ncbi:MAG: heterodisulfide reductase-related iron-sulfur binding cluster, partial [Candidatus Bathyarchaeia archaeon]